MGLFDTVSWVKADEAPQCPAGHALMEFQTKDRSWPSLEYLYIQGGTILMPVSESDREVVLTRDGRPVLQRTTDLTPVTESQTLVLTTTCTECEPVMSWDRRSGGMMRTEHPLQQFRLTISSGVVQDCAPIERETTATLYERQKSLGLHVVPIDSDLYRQLLEDARA